MALRAMLILAAAVFLVTLLVRLPARALLGLLPADVSCTLPAGTVWSGSCGQLRVNTLEISNLSWVMHPAALLRLRFAADVASQDPAANGHARLELAPNGDLEISGLVANVALPAGSGPLPAGTSGALQLAIDSARIQARHLVALLGKIDVQSLRIENPPADLGSFELQFAPPSAGAAMTGQLRDLNGPLAVSGLLQVSPAGLYDLEGTVAPRPSASADLTQALQLLGAPDAQGRRAFSLAGSL
jgi:Type II secretion system (T2SS), protein N